MDFTYYLPGPNNTRIEYNTSSNSVIIIGANGSGKSKLGAWIEKNYAQNTHRIGAQRSLEFGTYIKQMSYEQATNKLISGSEEQTQNHDHRWKWDGEKWDYTSALLVDYESVLSAVWAKQTKQESEYIAKCRERDHLGQSHDAVPEMVVDKLSRIWSTVFPHRNIHFTDGKVTASFTLGENLVQYKGKDMSDGERVALYLMCQALGVPENKTVIIDEPELHLHRSIMNRLWSAIEQARQDCLFIYITHDTQFAANHQQSQKIWVKEFDGANWIFEKVEDSAIAVLIKDGEEISKQLYICFVERGKSMNYLLRLYRSAFQLSFFLPISVFFFKSMITLFKSCFVIAAPPDNSCQKTIIICLTSNG
jgi:ATPase subunit of ABC transporter with duplicated ATPase domains